MEADYSVYFSIVGVIPSDRRDQVMDDLKACLSRDLLENRPFELDFSADTLQSVDLDDNETELSETVRIHFYPQVSRSPYQFFSVATPALNHAEIQTSSVLIGRLKMVADVAQPIAMTSIIRDHTPYVVQDRNLRHMMDYHDGIFYFSDLFAHGLDELEFFQTQPFGYRIYRQKYGWLCVRPYGVGNEHSYLYTNSSKSYLKWRQVSDDSLQRLQFFLVKAYDWHMEPVLNKVSARISALPPNT